MFLFPSQTSGGACNILPQRCQACQISRPGRTKQPYSWSFAAVGAKREKSLLNADHRTESALLTLLTCVPFLPWVRASRPVYGSVRNKILTSSIVVLWGGFQVPSGAWRLPLPDCYGPILLPIISVLGRPALHHQWSPVVWVGSSARASVGNTAAKGNGTNKRGHTA